MNDLLGGHIQILFDLLARRACRRSRPARCARSPMRERRGRAACPTCRPWPSRACRASSATSWFGLVAPSHIPDATQGPADRRGRQGAQVARHQRRACTISAPSRAPPSARISPRSWMPKPRSGARSCASPAPRPSERTHSRTEHDGKPTRRNPDSVHARPARRDDRDRADAGRPRPRLRRQPTGQPTCCWRRMAEGESADVAILVDAAIDALTRRGTIAAGSRRDLARSGVGIAVAAGAAKPDIGTVEAFRQRHAGGALDRLFEKRRERTSFRGAHRAARHCRRGHPQGQGAGRRGGRARGQRRGRDRGAADQRAQAGRRHRHRGLAAGRVAEADRVLGRRLRGKRRSRRGRRPDRGARDARTSRLSCATRGWSRSASVV